jgi:hypothetical protein
MAQANARTSRRRSTTSRSKSGSRNGTSRTKTSSGRNSSGSRKASGSRTSSRARSSSSSARGRSSSKTSRARSAPRSRNGRSTIETVGGTVKETATNGASSVGSAARSVGDVAKRAKTPLLAGGAALAGFAGAAIVRSQSNSRGRSLSSLRGALPGRSHSAGFSLPRLPKRGNGLKGGVRKVSQNVAEAAEQADLIGQRVSNVANAVRRVSETADKAAKKA